MDIEFWIDPICPWCWVTARWIVDEVEPARDLNVLWQPISLLLKNSPKSGSQYRERTAFSHKLLRVMESVRTTDGNTGVFKLYWEFGRRIHHDNNSPFPISEALTSVNLDSTHATAFDCEDWDENIRERMNVGLQLAGDDIGTPIIAFLNDNREKVALFGPVITRVPSREDSLRLWDGFITCATTPGFWEIKRTRTEAPEFGLRP